MQPEYTGLFGASGNTRKLSEAGMRARADSDASQRAKNATVRDPQSMMSVDLQSETASKFSTTDAGLVSAEGKALRDLDDFKRAFGEQGTRAKAYRKQAEAAAAGNDLLTRENNDLKTKLSELQRSHASLRRSAEAAVSEERRRSAASLQEQLYRLKGPAGFDVLKHENLDLQKRLSGLQHHHGELKRQAQAAINAAEERARASEVGRAAAYDLSRKLEAQLSSVMDQASKLHQAAAASTPAAAAVTAHGSAADPPPAPVRQQQQVPRHLRDIEKWFDGIPERFRGNVRAAKLGKHLTDNVNNKQGLEDAIAEVKRLTIQVTPLVPRKVRSHILRGPEGWASPPGSPSLEEDMSDPPSAPEPATSAPILPTAFANPGVVPT